MPSNSPPRYEPVSTREDDDLFESQKVDDGSPVSPASYPPNWQGPLGGGSGTSARNVIYTFVPRWPASGLEESVLGKVGGKEDAIAIVRHAFLTLSEYPPHRIEFLAPVTPDTKIHDITQWSKILEDAWGGIQSDPPARLKVQVVDLPGQAEQRARREAWRPILIVSSIIVPFFIVMAVMVILSSLDIV